MHLTVEEALSIYPLSEARLIAGSKGKHRVIKSINVMDAPDISDWIKEGEMLLTTAYLIKDNLQEASKLLRTLNRRGSAGLGIKLGRFWNAVPEALIQEAEALNFPLIELPFQFTFSDQMNGLFRAEHSRSTNVLQGVLEKQRKLMRFALRSGRGRPLLEEISEVVGYPLAMIGSRGELVFNNTEYSKQELLEGWPWQKSNRRLRIGGQTGYRIPLVQGEKGLGYVLYGPIDPQILPVEESLFVQGAELIAYHVDLGLEECFAQSAHREFAEQLRRCLAGSLSCDELAQTAVRLDISLLQAPFRMLLTGASVSGETRPGELLQLKEAYANHPQLGGLDAVHVLLEDGLLSLFPAEPFAPDDFCAAIEDAIGELKLAGGVQPKAALSSVKTKTEGVREAFAETRECLELLSRGGGHVVHYRQLELPLLLSRLPLEAMEKYCADVLRGLMVREPEYVKEMLRTLEIYLENDGHVNETAKKLFIHRNTATYRIEKLSEQLDVDFKSIDDLLRLKLVFIFRTLLEMK